VSREYFLAKLIKAATGEGSRGGKIIGHTPSGKPIYDSEGHTQSSSNRKPYPGEEQHKLPAMKPMSEAQRKKTYMPPEGTMPHYSDEPPLKAYKVLMREFKKRGADFQGHITFNPKTGGIETLTPEGDKIAKDIIGEMRSKATPKPGA
jgi:hypothetical protein